MEEELKYCRILGTKIHVITMDKTVEYLDRHLERIRGGYVCVSNVHTTVMAFRDPDYQKIQNGSVLNLPDGKPLSIVCRHRGFKEAARVPGPDLMPRIFALSEKRGYRHYFYGSSPETLKKLREMLQKTYPDMVIAGMESPPYRPLSREEDEAAVERINESRPDFIWVGLGAPKQEIWMAKHAGKVSGVMLGVGAGFDFLAGTVKRAPKWMQEACLEWLFRLLQDPRRLIPRYVDTNFKFLHEVARENRRRRKEKPFRIAMIGHKRIPSREGGVEMVVDALATRLVRMGYQVDAYNRSGYHVSGKQFDKRRGKYYNGIRIHTIPTFNCSSLNAIVYAALASVRALFGRYDVIHFHAEGPCIMLWLPKLFGIRTVATIHGLDWQRSKWGNFASAMLRRGEKTAARCADEVIVLSENMQRYFWETYGRRTVFIPNGIERPERREPEFIRETYGLNGRDYILFLARIVPEKGLHYLIEAFLDIETDKKLVIAGGSSHSQEYMKKITDMAAQDERILMTGFVQGEILAELYSNAYCFVLPSDVEGMALSLLEAMSYGNCCIVSDIRENTEVVGEKALRFEKGNVESLRAVLKRALDEERLCEQYRLESADYICQKYDWDKVVLQTAALYAGKDKNA